MTERLPCTSPGCEHTILPSTAERTGGVCMPCANRRHAEEWERHVAANRVDVDRFAGIHDPVEIILRIHEGVPRDELKNYLPYCRKTADVYRELLQSDADRLVERVGSELLETVASHLACFGEVNLTKCQLRLLDADEPYPHHVFRGAADPVVQRLIASAERREGWGSRHALFALAWTRSDAAVAALRRWADESPRRRERVRQATHEAGFEIVDCRIRELTSSARAFRMVPRDDPNADERTLSLFVPDPSGRTCPHCDGPATRLLDVQPEQAAALGLPQFVPTCLLCVPYTGHLFVKHDAGEAWNWIATAPDRVTHDQDWGFSPTHVVLVPRRPWEAVDWCIADGMSQVGGHPSWINQPDPPACPSCTRAMPFVAQVAPEDFLELTEGAFHVHHCIGCAVVAVGYQQS